MKAALSEKNIRFEFADISASMAALKSYLVMRDTSEAFQKIRGTRTVGVPLLVVDGMPYVLDDERPIDEMIEKLGLAE